MSEAMRNAMRGEAERAGRQVAQTRMGVVDGVEPSTHTVRVRLQPDDTLTGWIPVAALSVGAGYGLHALPDIGAQVVVAFQEGSVEAGVVVGALYSAAQKPPATPVGAIWLTSKGGARLQLNADGSVDVLAANIRIGAIGATFRRLMNEVAMAVFNSHTHGSGPGPTPQMNAADHLTTNLRGS